MKRISDQLSILIFNILATCKGYRFEQVKDLQDCNTANLFYSSEGFVFANPSKEKIRLNRAGVVCFLAYHKDVPVGVVKLVDPHKVNLEYEVYGMEETGIDYEIQHVLVKKATGVDHAFVLLGLFKAMYQYSVSNTILTWSAEGVRDIYMTLRQYCNMQQVTGTGMDNRKNPLAKYLRTKQITESSFTMEVAVFRPFEILTKNIVQRIRRTELFFPADFKRISVRPA